MVIFYDNSYVVIVEKLIFVVWDIVIGENLGYYKIYVLIIRDIVISN